MANTKSAIKQARQNLKRRARNRVYRATARTYVKKARTSINSGQFDEAQEMVKAAIRSLDRAAQAGVIHKNNAARRKSRLVRLLHQAQSA